MLVPVRELEEAVRLAGFWNYQLYEKQLRRKELYIARGVPEALRNVFKNEVSLRLHKKKASFSESHLQLHPPFTALPRLLSRASALASWASSPEYLFPAAGTLIPHSDSWHDAKVNEDLPAVLNETMSRSAQKLRNSSLASWEIITETTQNSVHNQSGFSATWQESRLHIDYILLSKNGTPEIGEYRTFRHVDDVDLEEILQREAQYLSDMGNAKLPKTGTYPVLFSEEGRGALFDHYMLHLSGQALFHGFSAYRRGKSIYMDVKGESFSLASNPFVPGGEESGPVDSYGFPLARTELIENGVVKDFLIDGRYAHILSLPRTSAGSNVEVTAGQESLSSLRSPGVLELVRFSAFSPNDFTGAFSAEIRLGYLHTKNGKIPVRGGSVSGNVRDAFSAARFSREQERTGRYSGPAGILFDTLTIAGEP